MSNSKTILGVDYGSKLAGTTVVAFIAEGGVKMKAAVKGQDADNMLLELCREHKPSLVAIDAPLSLPGVFTGVTDCQDYFYRACDKETKAMSPMFLGGLTARAMKLAAQLRLMGTEVIEAYPVRLGQQLGLGAFGYRKKEPNLKAILDALEQQTGMDISEVSGLTGHHIDAALALHIGNRYISGQAECFGKQEEGIIYY
jgi:predicted nuclease with RNAse H fold